MRVDTMQRLTSRQLSEVLSLVEAAALEDNVPPLSEQVLLAARGEPATSSARHFLAYDGTHLAGYAHLEPGPAGEVATAEVVVDPGHRRKGFGSGLIHALEDALKRDVQGVQQQSTSAGAATITLQLWSHGHLEGARAFALRDGYSTVRELWQMCRSLPPSESPSPASPSPGSPSSGSLPDVSLPEGFAARHFRVGQDEDAWLQVNARAFVDHPEQGRMTRADLDQRIAEPWFDTRGFILIEDLRGSDPVLVASHWTKVVPAADSGPSATKSETQVAGDEPPASTTNSQVRVAGDEPLASATTGEVYVVGVDPAYQGLGLGRAVTILGLVYLRDRGLSEATLYVEADNGAAIATYSRLGFARCGVDTMYSRTVQSRL